MLTYEEREGSLRQSKSNKVNNVLRYDFISLQRRIKKECFKYDQGTIHILRKHLQGEGGKMPILAYFQY